MNNPAPTAPENPEPAARPPDKAGGLYERSLEELNEQQLWPMLLSIQQRLGTPSEQPTDLAEVRAIAHRLCNVLAVVRLKTELVQLKRETHLAGQAEHPGQCGQR